MGRPLKSGGEPREQHNIPFTVTEWSRIKRLQRDHDFVSVADMVMDFVGQVERADAKRKAMAERQKRDERAKEEAEMREIIRAHCKRMDKK